MELLTTSQSNFAGIPMIMGVDSQNLTWVKAVDVQKAVGKPDNSYRNFLRGKSSEAIQAKALASGEKVFRVTGYNKPVKFIPTQSVAWYWIYQANKGNKLAKALVVADLSSSLERQARETNGQQVTASQHEAKRASIREDLIAKLLDNYQAGTWLEPEVIAEAGLTSLESKIAKLGAYIKDKERLEVLYPESAEYFQNSIKDAQKELQMLKQLVNS